jgi:CHAT domain/Subtilase family
MIEVPKNEEPQKSRSGFEVFDLSAQLGPGMVPWISASSRMGVVHGVPRSGSPPIDELIDHVYDYADSVHFAEPVPLPELVPVLQEMVFGDGEILELFHATRGSAADRGRQLLVRILASPHLAMLPWELLPDPARARDQRGGRYLALAPDAHVARLARGRTYPTPTRTLEPPLNLLVTLSSPAGEDATGESLAFDIFEVKQSLREELRPLVEAGLLQVDFEERPTMENLRRRVGSRRGGYHLFHYVGHALPDLLVLEDESGRREDQPSDLFAEILRLCPDLQLMVFAGCETARAAGDPPSPDRQNAANSRSFLSLADRCVQDVCPVVIGMQAVLPFRTERLFTRFFYQGLATGYSIADSMRLARAAARGDRRVGGGLLDWSVPVLFLGGSDPGSLVAHTRDAKRADPVPRHHLKLGLRQSNSRFVARDIALRQSVDVMAGRTRERVLIVSGPPSVGKTFLIDRAMDEVETENPRVQILYVPLRMLAPTVHEAVSDFMADTKDDRLSPLKTFDPHAPLMELCNYVAELLAKRDGKPAERPGNLSAPRWWERLVEEMTQRQMILILDDADLLENLEWACLVSPTAIWLGGQLTHLSARELARSAEHLELLLDDLRGEDGQNPTRRKGQDLRKSLLGLGRDLKLEESRHVEVARGLLAQHAQEILARLAEGTTTPEKVVEGCSERARNYHPDLSLELLKQAGACRNAFGTALTTLADRRSETRLVLVGTSPPRNLLKLKANDRSEIRLGRITWPEAWRWIRRNLPGLVGLGESYLFPFWSHLGAELDHWEALERAVLAKDGRQKKLTELLAEILPASAPTTKQTPPVRDDRPRGERALRIAVAGPYIAEEQEVADAFARLAVAHGVGGRVVVGQPDESGALAVLIDEESPFRVKTEVLEDDITSWLRRIAERGPDIVLLDYGAPATMTSSDQHTLLKTLARNCLLIGATNNSEGAVVGVPAAYPEVLAVGCADRDGKPKLYTSLDRENGKPDILMEDNLEGTPLRRAINLGASPSDEDDPRKMAGSSFAALHAVGAAVLVWSLLPDCRPRAVKELLLEASIVPGDGQWPRFLSLHRAAEVARERVLSRALRDGPCSIATLSAITGVEFRFVKETMERQFSAGKVRRIRGRVDLYAQ